MKTIKTTGESVCENREELCKKYFDGLKVYSENNMGIVTLLSDTQELLAMSVRNKKEAEHYRQILNDIKCVLIEDNKKRSSKIDLYYYKAKVLGVVDGDTLDLSVDLGLKITSEQRVRLAGIDAPEIRSRDKKEKEAGLRAKKFVVKKVSGKTVLVKTEKKGKFGRYLATIYYGRKEKNLNKELVEKGLAVEY